MKVLINSFAVLLTILFASACAHSPSKMADERKEDYEKSVENRINQMEDNIESLRAREDQLLGAPRAELSDAVANLEQEVSASRAQLEELRNRNSDTWVSKKGEVDRQLQEMDNAYDDALEVIVAD